MSDKEYKNIRVKTKTKEIEQSVKYNKQRIMNKELRTKNQEVIEQEETLQRRW